jgi:hypothetical protein
MSPPPLSEIRTFPFGMNAAERHVAATPSRE